MTLPSRVIAFWNDTIYLWEKVKLLSSEIEVKKILGEPYNTYFGEPYDSMLRSAQKKHLEFNTEDGIIRVTLAPQLAGGQVIRVDAPDGNYIDGIKRKW